MLALVGQVPNCIISGFQATWSSCKVKVAPFLKYLLNRKRLLPVSRPTRDYFGKVYFITNVQDVELDTFYLIKIALRFFDLEWAGTASSNTSTPPGSMSQWGAGAQEKGLGPRPATQCRSMPLKQQQI